MRWLDNFFRRRPSPLATPWQNPLELRQVERQARVADAQALAHLSRTENNSAHERKFKAIVAGFDGVKEIEVQQRLVHSGKECPQCGYHGVQRLWGKERRCAQCGRQWLSG
jgi:predicted Zn-ribbon and HTH transcriptional regulator